MLLHPKVALYIYFAVLGIGLVSLLRRDPTCRRSATAPPSACW